MDVAELKRKHRFIFCTEIAERLIYWRPLTLREHDIYIKIIELKLSPVGKVQDLIFREICLDPSIIDQMNQTPAGLVPSIVNAALTISGNLLRSQEEMDKMNNDLEEMRQAINSNPFEQFFLFICKAFPTYTPSDLETLEYQEILRLLVMAEQIIGLEHPIKLEPQKQESITDKLFKDANRAESIDRGAPSAVDIRDILAEKQKDSLSIREAKKIEMERRLRQRAGR
jgi:hypothetical protein